MPSTYFSLWKVILSNHERKVRKTVKNKSLPSITGVGKLQPKDQIQPIASFGTAHELRMVFTFLNGGKKNQEQD